MNLTREAKELLLGSITSIEGASDMLMDAGRDEKNCNLLIVSDRLETHIKGLWRTFALLGLNEKLVEEYLNGKSS